MSLSFLSVQASYKLKRGVYGHLADVSKYVTLSLQSQKYFNFTNLNQAGI